MQIHIPDPAFTGSQRSRDNFRLAVKLSLGFVALLWLVHILNWGLDLGPGEFGVRPRQIAGLVKRLLCIFPFEEPWFRQRGVNAEYIGHPLAKRIQPPSVR